MRSYLPADHPDKSKEGGSQPTPGAFIDWLVDVVEALDRVLAPHGSMVIELGDTYAGSGGENHLYEGTNPDGGFNGSADFGTLPTPKRGRGGWPASKSLTLIPELFRMTLVYGTNPLTGRQTRLWRLRNVIRWVRPNPPVGALGDKFRPATSELMVFCRTDEAGRRRYFDLDSVRGEFPERPHGGHPNAVKRSANAMPTADGRGRELDSNHWNTRIHPAGAPPLDWWEIPPGGYQGAHYAVFPEALCVKPIRAMCPEKVCRTCGEPSRRIVGEVAYTCGSGVHAGSPKDLASLTGRESREDGANRRNVQGVDNGNMVVNRPTLGWSDCSHDNYRPGTVLDPFAGSGTTLAVAVGHGRDAIGIDLDARNLDLARQRVGMFLEAV